MSVFGAEDSRSVRGLSAVVTGCGQGIGRSVIELLARSGYHVLGIEQDETAASEVRQVVGDVGAILVGDVSDRRVLLRAATQARELGPLAAWVNNAAIDTSSNLHRPVVREVERLLAVNLMGYYWGCSAAVSVFLEQRAGGSIVNVSSVHGRAGYSNAAAYDVSKGGVDALTRYVAVEYGPVGIRANAVAPGAVRTPMNDKAIRNDPDPQGLEAAMARVPPLRRMAEPSEISAVIAFLLSDSASYITGQSIAVDGGLTARCWDFTTLPDLEQMNDGFDTQGEALRVLRTPGDGTT